MLFLLLAPRHDNTNPRPVSSRVQVEPSEGEEGGFHLTS